MQRGIWHWLAWTALAAVPFTAVPASADEQLFGFVRGAETVPKGGSELYQFVTIRAGKPDGTYYAMDFENEIEHGFTDQLQASLGIVQRYIYAQGVDGSRDELPDTNNYRWGGITTSAKYRILSPFKDPVGIAFRVEGGYLWHDEVGGLPEHEYFIAPELDFQKDFLDDTLITQLWFGPEWAWGKKPAEEYPRELSVQGGIGVSYRFAPNWFIGVETNVRSEFPMFDFNNFEHVVIYAGPALHYGAERWWATLTIAPQIWGDGVGEPHDGRTYAEEQDVKIRLKIGFNF